MLHSAPNALISGKMPRVRDRTLVMISWMVASWVKATLLCRNSNATARRRLASSVFPGELTFRLRRALINYHFGGFYMALRFIVAQPTAPLLRYLLRGVAPGHWSRRRPHLLWTVLFTFGLDEAVHLALRTMLTSGMARLVGTPVRPPTRREGAETRHAADGSDAHAERGKSGGGGGGNGEHGVGADADDHGSRRPHEYECAICQTPQGPGEGADSLHNYCTRAPLHLSHRECMHMWFTAGQAGSHTCPVCRAPLRTHTESVRQRVWVHLHDAAFYEGLVSRLCVDTLSWLAALGVLRLLSASEILAARLRAWVGGSLRALVATPRDSRPAGHGL